MEQFTRGGKRSEIGTKVEIKGQNLKAQDQWVVPIHD